MSNTLYKQEDLDMNLIKNPKDSKDFKGLNEREKIRIMAYYDAMKTASTHPMLQDVVHNPKILESYNALNKKDQAKIDKLYAQVTSGEVTEWHNFKVPGKPLVVNSAKARNCGGFIQIYVPGKGKEEKRIHKYLGPIIKEKYGIRPVPLTTKKTCRTEKDGRVLFPKWKAVEMFITYYLARPKNLTKFQRVVVDMNVGVPLGRPDVDNLCKLQLDWSKDYLFLDDSTVQLLGGMKYYAEDEPYVVLSIRERKRFLPTLMKGKYLDDVLKEA